MTGSLQRIKGALEARRGTPVALASAAIGAALLIVLYLLSRHNYLLFHSATELYSTFVAFSIFVVAWNARAWTSNRYLLFLGMAYLFVAIVDATHTLAYKGMGVFPTHGSNEATQLWILARYIEAFSLLAAPLFITRRMRIVPLLVAYAAVSGFGLLAIWRLGIFPACFIEGQGVTPFKVASEFVISGLLVGAVAHHLRYRDQFVPRVFALLVAAMVVTIVAEMAFTLYTDVYGILNMSGHLLKAISFYLIYCAVVATSLAAPFASLFRDLTTSQERLGSLVEQSMDAILSSSRDGRVVEANESSLNLFGYSREEMSQLNVTDLYVDHEARTRFLSWMGSHDALADDEVQFRRKDGSVVDCLRTAIVLRVDGGEVTGFRVVLRDVTQQKQSARALREGEQQLLESRERLAYALEGTIDVIQHMLAVRDPYTAGHQRHVAELAAAIARQMRLPDEPCVHTIRAAALVHDIGKIAVPAEILSKPGRLSDAEFALVKCHPSVGYDILKRARLDERVVDTVHQHHEMLDGSGYPQGLSGNAILPEAQILAVADVVEAMFSHRPYRAGLGIDAALAELSIGSGTRYSGDVVAACLAVFREGEFAFSG